MGRLTHRKSWVAMVLLLAWSAGCGRFAPAESQLADENRSPAVYLLDRHGTEPIPAEQRSYVLAASLYAGWMPWYYAADSGILAKWAEREGIEIRFESLDYIASLEAFVMGRADACLATNIDALGLPAAAGVDTTVLVIGDYSNGNDKLLARGISSLAGLRGQEVLLVELSVSDYLLGRALEQTGMSPREVRIVNTGDAKIGREFLSDSQPRAVVTWNPIARELERQQGVRVLFDSGQVPGEILDLCLVNTEVLREDPRLGRALVGAWYEVLELMRREDATGSAAISRMAELAGCNAAEFRGQLATTQIFWTPREAGEFAVSDELQDNMDLVRQFCFAKKLFGEEAQSADDIGIEFADGAVQGDRENVRLRFDASFVKRAK